MIIYFLTVLVLYQFWRVFFECLKRYFNNIELNKKNVLLRFQTLQGNLLLNLLTIITIITKNYIYKCKFKDKIPNIVELKFKTKNYYSLELYIARKNNKLAAFEKLWGPLKYVFPDL